jgi:predicted dehydrogenase
MKLAILGADDESIALARWAVEHGGHALVAAFASAPRGSELYRFAPQAKTAESWESLIAGSGIDAVIVGRGAPAGEKTGGLSAAERRDDRLRKLVQAAVPLVIVCPACEAIVGFELEMIRRDTRGVIVPYVPGLGRPEISRLVEIASWGEASPIGRVEQVTFEREMTDRSRSAVLAQLSRDISLLRQLIGTVQAITAHGEARPIGRDPLGPKSTEPPSLANLTVSLSGDEGLIARWAVIPALAKGGGRLALIGERGKAVLSMPADAAWSLTGAGQLDAPEEAGEPLEAAAIFQRMSHAISTDEFYDDAAWLAVCRDQEAAEAVDRSLERGRTIELYNEAHSEAESFKGLMAMGGCLMLLLALGMLLLAVAVEALHLPIRGWRMWRLWPVYLLAPLALFLLLQFLQMAVKREDGGRTDT